MVVLFKLIAALFACLAAIPAGILFAQAVLALRPRKDTFATIANTNPDTVVLIPAHNEERRVRRTIRSVLKSGEEHLRVLVIADNCSDSTAQTARTAGAEVVERTNQDRLGKAYALEFGIQHLRSSPPDVVIVVDADAVMGGAGAGRIASIAQQLRRPVQSLNVIDRRSGSGNTQTIIATLGNRLHNIVRPLGFARLGLPCLLLGSGMAFPWETIDRVGLENDELGEDKQLGIDMALAGYPPIYCLETKVASHVTEEYSGYVGQRTRWEQGHLLSAIKQIPVLISTAFRQGRWSLLALAVDLAVPPIAVIAAVWSVALLFSVASWLLGGWQWPLVCTVVTGVVLAGVIGITWAGFARRKVPAMSLLGVPYYVLRKLPIYVSLLANGPQRVWLRSDRSA